MCCVNVDVSGSVDRGDGSEEAVMGGVVAAVVVVVMVFREVIVLRKWVHHIYVNRHSLFSPHKAPPTAFKHARQASKHGRTHLTSFLHLCTQIHARKWVCVIDDTHARMRARISETEIELLNLFAILFNFIRITWS